MKLLGIDFGLKKIGLAIADSESRLVEPLGMIRVKNNLQEALRQIDFICKKENVERIILGLSEGCFTEIIKKFGVNLKKITHLPVFYEDENLTSKEAIAKMIQAGIKKMKRREKEDQVAAALVLQNYLNKNYV